jgi:hypothetical protein
VPLVRKEEAENIPGLGAALSLLPRFIYFPLPPNIKIPARGHLLTPRTFLIQMKNLQQLLIGRLEIRI